MATALSDHVDSHAHACAGHGTRRPPGATIMVGLKRFLLLSLVIAGLTWSSGCCCSPCGGCGGGCGSSCGGCNSCGSCGSCGGCCPLSFLFCKRELPDDYRGGGSYWCDCGCGELYCGDWHSYPPTCDPCDCCGNYVGPHEHDPSYQLPQRYNTAGPAPPPPVTKQMNTPYDAPQQPTPAPATSRKRRSSNGTVQASYNAPQPHCESCGN